jgi:thiol-disulfide isomerase/thioredoxin
MRILYTILILQLLSGLAYAQQPPQMPPPPPPGSDTMRLYEKKPDLPEFKIMLMDSVTIFNTADIPKGKPIMFVFFDPGCKHCKDFTQKMVEAMDSLQDVRIYMLTFSHDLASLRGFCTEYHLNDYKNIKLIGRDYEFFYMTFYAVMAYPDVAIYDKKKKFVKHFAGEIPVTELYNYTH